MSTPTFAQEEYAASLVQRLREESFHLEANRFGRLVLECQDRTEMSRLIDQMKKILES